MVSCDNCRHCAVGSFGCVGEEIYLRMDVCLNSSIRAKGSAINNNNDCTWYTPSSKVVTGSGYLIDRNPGFWTRVKYAMSGVDYD